MKISERLERKRRQRTKTKTGWVSLTLETPDGDRLIDVQTFQSMVRQCAFRTLGGAMTTIDDVRYWWFGYHKL